MGRLPTNQEQRLEVADFGEDETKPETDPTQEEALAAFKSGNLDEARRLLDEMAKKREEETASLDKHGEGLAKELKWARTLGESDDNVPEIAERLGRILGQLKVLISGGKFEIAEKLLEISNVKTDIDKLFYEVDATVYRLKQTDKNAPDWKKKMLEFEEHAKKINAQFNALDKAHNEIEMALKIEKEKNEEKTKIKPAEPEIKLQTKVLPKITKPKRKKPDTEIQPQASV